tara:strand:+ start:4523 stop:4741 length:219 start_codon:yes stop_codon:yes gene_type:complete
MTPSISSSSFVAAEGKRIQIDVDVRRTCEEAFFLREKKREKEKKITTTTTTTTTITTRNYARKLYFSIIYNR